MRVQLVQSGRRRRRRRGLSLRARFWAVSLGCFAASGFCIQACSSSSTDDAPSDAGLASEISPSPRGVDATDAPPLCDPNKDYLKDIPDAAIPDSGSTTGLCFGCAHAKCADVIANCGRDCTCQHLSAGAADCYVRTKQISCAFAFANYPAVSVATRQLALALLGCVQQGCTTECAFDPSTSDGGADAADAGAADR